MNFNHQSHEQAAIHVLDLPQLYARPSAQVLVRTLERLAVRPASFDGGTDIPDDHEGGISEDGVPKYLTGIIASRLAWIDDEDVREKIWEVASTRLSERSGRTGILSNTTSQTIPSVSRTFHIPTTTATTTTSSSGDPSISITLYEPSLTSDNLGHKTWTASYLLAKRLPHLLSHFRSLVATLSGPSEHSNKSVITTVEFPRQQPQQQNTPPSPFLRILELGSGTGLVGIAASAIFSTHVLLTDLPAIVPNLHLNVEANKENVIHANGGTASVAVLDWSDCHSSPSLFNNEEVKHQEEQHQDPKYNIILAADPLYSPHHPQWLADTISRFLVKGKKEAIAVVELPLREAYRPEVEAFKTRMDEKGLELREEGEEVGFDDWRDGKEEVRCWWGVWAWKITKS